MIGCSGEILEKWPKHRDPELPPFFIYTDDSGNEIHNRRRYRIGGTLRSGNTFRSPIPKITDEDCGREMNFDEAIRTAEKLNDLHHRGLIDWNGGFPKITEDWIKTATRAIRKISNPTI